MMKNKLFILILLLLTSNSYSQDCAGMRDNEEHRLDASGGPLFQSRIQDQDGLGTCYANAASVALQTALVNNPDVSYLQLAFSHGEKIQAPKNVAKGIDSAFQIGTNDTKGNVLIYGGQVCDSINAVKDTKIGGVCLREDVALEKIIFDSKTKHSKDGLAIQKSVIDAVSEYYDSTKTAFGTSSVVARDEIAKRALAFNNYKKSFDELIKEKQENYSKEACLKPDTSNVQKVVKNSLARIYNYLNEKYQVADYSHINKNTKGKEGPDTSLFFFWKKMGSIYTWNGNSELEIRVDSKLTSLLEAKYMTGLNSSAPPTDGLSALKDTLLKYAGSDKSSAAVVDRIIKDLSPEDKDLLSKDYNRYVKKDVKDCMNKNVLTYYKNDDGLIKDFEHDQCLKSYLIQGQNIKNLAIALDKYNFDNIDALNSFMSGLPSMSYEEAMRAIVAPDCGQDKKIKIPETLICEPNYFDYIHALKLKLVNSGVSTYEGINQRIRTEERNENAQIELEYIQRLRSLETEYVNKTDATSLKLKEDKINELTNEKIKKINRTNDVVSARVTKQLAGDRESQYWNEYVTENKRKFNSDAINLLRNSKQAVPISLCTRLFTDPTATALRDGSCEKTSSDNNYKDVGGHHAVTLVGVRCQRGKLNYLIQNSWGEWNAIKDPKNADGSQHYPSEFGKAWMNEDEIMNNAFGYQKISK